MEKKRFNVLDWLIVLFCIAVLAGGAWFLTSRGKSADKSADKTVVAVLEVKEQYGAFETMLKHGEVLYDKVQNVEYGVLEDYEILPATKTTVSQLDGTVRNVEIPDRYDFHLSIRVPESEKVVVGKNLSLKAKLYRCSGYVIEVRDTDSDKTSDEK